MANFFLRLAAAADRFPERPAIEVLRQGRIETTTFAALLGSAAQFSAWLARAGVRRGDRIAILADNDARWIACYLGAFRFGAFAVPLDTAYKAAQVSAILEHSGARVLFTTPRYLATATAAAGTPGANAVTLVLLSGESPGLAGPADVAAARPIPPVAEAADDDAAVILYTSGTTADPKGVVLTHANLEAEREAVFQVIGVDETDVVLGVLPLFHALAQMANMLLPLSVGARVVFLETVSSSSLLDALQTRGVTIFACVPQFFYLIHQRVTAQVARAGRIARLLFRSLVAANAWLRDHVGWNPGRWIFGRVHRTLGPCMRLLVTGGSQFDPAIGRDLYGLGFRILNVYGLTETSGGATLVRPGDRYSPSVGHPLPGVEVRIRTAESADAAAGSRTSKFDVRGPDTDAAPAGTGEILIRGPIIMREYFGRPDATADAIHDGWLHTGDLGRLDADGRLYITGRKKEIIVLSSGKNLYPEEIEAHYRRSPYIKELCILGLKQPDQPAAERLHAVVVPNDETMRERGIVNVGDRVRFEIESLSAELPAHKRLLTYDMWFEPLPRTTTGKLRRHLIDRQVRERASMATSVERPLSDAEREWQARPEHARVLSAIAARLERSEVRPDANLELDLGLDSMERVELLTMLEQRHGTRVPADARATIFTARQLVDAVLTAPSASGAPVDASGDSQDQDQLWATLLAEPPDEAVAANLAKRKVLAPVLGFVLLRALRLAWSVAIRYRVRGVDRLPRRGPFLICPNHLTYLDGVALCAALPFRTLREIFIVGAAEQWETPFRARIARFANIVPVDPDASLVSAMRAGAAGLRLKKVLLLFPEGERSIDGRLKRFRKGAAILASGLEVPIVPVGLDGLFELWPRGRPFDWRVFRPLRSRHVTVTFGDPVTVARGQVVAGTTTLRSAVEALLPRGGTPP